MMKKWFRTMLCLITVLILSCTASLLVACSNSSGEEANDSYLNEGVANSNFSQGTDFSLKSISVDQTTLKILIGESVQLNATCKNVEEDSLVWTSSNEQVVSVSQSGKVTALKEGSATVTVKSGDVKAECKINVYESDVAPIFTLSVNQLSLKTGDSFSVTATVTYNGKEENAEYNWYFEDGKTSSECISYTLAQSGKIATFTAVKPGVENVCVSTVVKGFELVEYLTVSAVENDVYFKVDNLQGQFGGYYAEVALAEVEGHVASITPEIEVFISGEKQTGADIVWENRNPEVAQIDDNGTIVGLSEGTATFVANVTAGQKSAPLNVTIKVYTPKVELKINSKNEVDFNNSSSTFEVNFGELANSIRGAFAGVTLNGVPFKSAVYNNAKLLLDKETLGEIYTEQEMVATFLTKKADAIVAVETVTAKINGYRSISSIEELNSMESYMQMIGSDAYADLRLTCDIDMKGATLAGVGTFINTGAGWIANYPFKGVFDGNGHTIYNAVESGTNSGLFCSIASGGVIKNVKFINATITGNTGLISTSSDGGLVENVFVYGKITGQTGNSGIPISFLVSKNYGTIKNSFVITDSSSLVDYGGMLTGSNYGSVIDCVAINLSGKPLYGVGSVATKGIVKAGECGITGVFGNSYSDFAKYREETVDYDYDDWASAALQSIIDENVGASLRATEISVNSSATLSIKNKCFVQSYTTSTDAVIVNNGVINVTADATLGEKVKVSVNYVDGTKDELTFIVIKDAIVIAERRELDVRTEGITIDVSNYANAGSMVKWATFGSSAVNGITIKEGVITIPSESVGQGKNDWGNIELTIRTDTELFEVPLFVYVSVRKALELDTMMAYLYQTGAEVYNKGQDVYGYVLLMNDIDMYLYPFGSIGDGYWSGSFNTWSRRFYGTFDGQGYAIMNWDAYEYTLDVNFEHQSNANRGLFSCIAESGVVKNIRFTNIVCTQSGAVATQNYGIIENIFVEGTIRDGGISGIPVGMVVGKNEGTVRNCVVICKGVPENAEDSFGSMLVGRTGSTNITNCVAINVSGKKIFAVGTAGLTVGSCTEQAPASNKIYDSWEAYEADKGNISIDDWAEEYISTAKNS